MVKTRAWPVRAMYILIAAALVISLIIVAAPARKVSAAPAEVAAKWTKVSTPVYTPDKVDWVLAPGSFIRDYALDANGEVAYAVVGSAYEENWFLLKSTDHAATWTDITDALDEVIDPDDEDLNYIEELIQVATDWVDPDFVAVALWWYDSDTGNYYLNVFFSTDGGETFIDAEEVKADSVYLDLVADLAVSYEADGKREIAIGGKDSYGYAALFRCTVTGDSPSAWKDATAYDGWDDDGAFDSELVTDIIFSPKWTTDKTILVTTANATDVWLQCGSWGTSAGWNKKSTLGIEAVPIIENVALPMWLVGVDARGIAGITLPEDYNSKNTDKRVLWVWVNYYDGDGVPHCYIARVDNDDAGPAVDDVARIAKNEVWLTNISYKGTIAEGEAIAGVLGTGTEEIFTECCEGVQVYRNDGIRNMFICCEPWKKACKPPTGRTAMAVSYVGEDKAYAVALQGVLNYDEGAWSVTFDDGDTWNQLSLIDTKINYLSDVAVSPDCNKTFLVSVIIEFGCGCDSVWLKAVNLPEAEEYSGKWLRTWCGKLEGKNSNDFDGFYERGLLRLAPEETTGETVFLVDRMSGNVYRNDQETLACWTPIASTEVTEIVDLAVKDADTLYALNADGKVAMFADDEWQKAVDSKVTNGWTIAVHGDDILVGGRDGDVSYSEDGGETFTLLEETPTINGLVTVAFDTYFDQNKIIYAATKEGTKGGIYRWVIDESTKWTDLKAESYGYTGLVLDRPAPGNPKTKPETGGVLYASYVYNAGNDTDPDYKTGVARTLTPAVKIVCAECIAWDYLTVGLTSELFDMAPDALKICGCLTADSNSKLFAIDGHFYDMENGAPGTVWTFEDCYAKKAVDVKSPVDGFIVPADPCSCDNVPFTVEWDRLCDACSYDIQFALDKNFAQIVSELKEVDFVPGKGDAPAYAVPGGILTCEFTYYYRVRAADAGTGQIIHSWWSDTRSVTIAPSTAAAEITLVSPAPGALNVPPKNTGFSWSLLAKADNFDWVLSKNADLSSPIEKKEGLTGTAYTCTKTLDYDTTYYWQVTAYKEGSAISMSAIGTFTTAAEIIPPEKEEVVTPAWVWVIIAIGAVLVIVVIVLIFRTRRV